MTFFIAQFTMANVLFTVLGSANLKIKVFSDRKLVKDILCSRRSRSR